jgi:hypothetical protein
MKNKSNYQDFIYYQSHNEQIIKQIIAKFRLSMSGITSECMTQKGIVYKKNYGVSTVRIKEISKDYQPSANLAKLLWNTNIRETKILATHLLPKEEANMDLINKWIDAIDTIELAEQLSMNLLIKTDNPSRIALECILSTNHWHQVIGWLMIPRIINMLDKSQTEQVITRGLSLSKSENYQLFKPIAIGLARLCRQGDSTAVMLQSKTQNFEISNSVSEQYIFNQIKQELLFLEN